jgi:hypothetical protein
MLQGKLIRISHYDLLVIQVETKLDLLGESVVDLLVTLFFDYALLRTLPLGFLLRTLPNIFRITLPMVLFLCKLPMVLFLGKLPLLFLRTLLFLSELRRKFLVRMLLDPRPRKANGWPGCVLLLLCYPIFPLGNGRLVCGTSFSWNGLRIL